MQEHSEKQYFMLTWYELHVVQIGMWYELAYCMSSYVVIVRVD